MQSSSLESKSKGGLSILGLRLSTSTLAYLAFTAVFAVLAGFVFWGTWSTDVAPVMPDDALASTVGYTDVWHRFLVDFLKNGKLVPTDIFWRGFFVSPYVCQELKYVSGLYLAGVALAYFLKGRGLSDLASYGAGLFLSFCGYWSSLFSAGHGGWFIWMSYGVFAFGLIDRALERGKMRHWLLLGAVLAWGSFYQADLWLLFTVFTAGYFVFRTTVTRLAQRHEAVAPSWAGWFKGSGFALAAFVLIGLPSFRSAIVNDLAGRDKQIADGETISQKAAAAASKSGDAAAAEREKRWIFVTNWSLPPAETLEFVDARVNGDTSCLLTQTFGHKLTGVRPYTGALGRPLGAPQGNYRQHSLYVGWLTCLLALVGIASLFVRRSRSERPTTPMDAPEPTYRATMIFFSCAAVLFYLLSLGRYCEPVYRVIFALPMGDYLRAPVKWHHLTEFCLVVLVGYGLDFLWRLIGDAASRRVTPSTARLLKCALVALVFWGAIDLARNDRLYCAPQPHNYQIQLADARQVASPQARQYLAQQGIKILASANGIAAIGRYQKPQPSKDPLPPFNTQTVLGLVSILASMLVLLVAAWNLSRLRFEGHNEP